MTDVERSKRRLPSSPRLSLVRGPVPSGVNYEPAGREPVVLTPTEAALMASNIRQLMRRLAIGKPLTVSELVKFEEMTAGLIAALMNQDGDA